MAGDDKEEDPEQELCQSYEPEIERAVGVFVDLPADGNRLHLVGEHDREAGRLEKHKTRIPKRDAAGGCGVFGFGHRTLLCHKNKLGSVRLMLCLRSSRSFWPETQCIQVDPRQESDVSQGAVPKSTINSQASRHSYIGEERCLTVTPSSGSKPFSRRSAATSRLSWLK